jgi:hypothetical protein
MKKPKANSKDHCKANTKSLNSKVYYEIEKILDRRTVNGDNFYLVKWKDYPSDFNTWEPVSSFNQCSLLIQNFDKNFDKKQKRRRPCRSQRNGKNPRKNIIKIKLIENNEDDEDGVEFTENLQNLEKSKNLEISQNFENSENSTINVINLMEDEEKTNNLQNSLTEEINYDTEEETEEIIDINKISSNLNSNSNLNLNPNSNLNNNIHSQESPERIISHELQENNEVIYKLEMKSFNLIIKSSAELRRSHTDLLVDYLEKKFIKNSNKV